MRVTALPRQTTFDVTAPGDNVPDAPSPAPEFKVEGPGVVAGVRQTASKAVVAVRRTGGSGLALEVKATAKGLVGSSLKLPME